MNDMRTYINLIESAEQLDEIDFKKAAATAGMIGALAGSPMDTQASTDAEQGIDTNQPVATQQLEPPREINYNHKQMKKLSGFHFKGGAFALGLDKTELTTAFKNIHDKRPEDIGEKISSVIFKPMGGGSGEGQMAYIQYSNGYVEITVGHGGKMPWLGGTQQVERESGYYILGHVKFVVGDALIPKPKSDNFDF